MNKKQEHEESELKPWYAVLIGLGLLVFSFYIYQECNALEQTGERMHARGKASIIAFLYDLGGKWTPTCIFALIGLNAVRLGVRQLWKNFK